METELQVGCKYKFWTPNEDSYYGTVISVHGGWVKIDRAGGVSFLNLAHVESIEVYR